MACNPYDLCNPPFDASTERWRDVVLQALSVFGLPQDLVDFVLAWIRVESDGDLLSTGCPSAPHCSSTLYEYGLFQVGYDTNGGGEANEMGIDWNTFLLSRTDPATSLRIGLMLIQKHARAARALLSQYGVSWPSPDVWKLVKGLHALPSEFRSLFPGFVAANGRGPSSWDELVDYARSVGARWDIITNADWVGSFAPPDVSPDVFASNSTKKKAKVIAGVGLLGLSIALGAFALTR